MFNYVKILLHTIMNFSDVLPNAPDVQRQTTHTFDDQAELIYSPDIACAFRLSLLVLN